jgi:hypothetical protein
MTGDCSPFSRFPFGLLQGDDRLDAVAEHHARSLGRENELGGFDDDRDGRRQL